MPDLVPPRPDAKRERTLEPFVVPFVVAVDTREQLPYRFENLRTDAKAARRPMVVRCERKGLGAGDYSIVGFESFVAIERKSLEDLYGTVGQGRDRFERELERLAQMMMAFVVIEATWQSILHHPPIGRRLSPKVIIRSVIAWQQRYPSIHWWTLPNRKIAEETTFRILERFYRGYYPD